MSGSPDKCETPRTDAVAVGHGALRGQTVDADFARQLERELAEKTKALERLLAYAVDIARRLDPAPQSSTVAPSAVEHLIWQVENGESFDKSVMLKALRSATKPSKASDAVKAAQRALQEFDDDVDMSEEASVAGWWNRAAAPALDALNKEWCQPAYGSCRLPSGHAGKHDAAPAETKATDG